MTATELTMVRGDTLDLVVTFTDNTGTLIDDAGAQYRMTAKFKEIDADPGVFSVTAHQSSAGTATLSVPPSSTQSLPAQTQSLVYDIQVTETGGRVTTIQYGSLIVTPDISVTTP